MCCLKWHKTLLKEVNQAPGEGQYLAQVNYTRAIWLLVAVIAKGSATAESFYSFPLRPELAAGDEWRKLRVHLESPSGILGLELQLKDTQARFRVFNQTETDTFTELGVSFEIFGDDEATVQELVGATVSPATDYYTGSEGDSGDTAAVDTERAARIAADNALGATINTLRADLNVEIQSRIDADNLLNARINAILANKGFWEPTTNGDIVTPEIVFADGDVVMAWNPG